MVQSTQHSVASDTAPPYFPFRSLTNLLVRMETEDIPRRLDRGYLSNMAGGSIAQFLTGLRSLGLIDAEEHPERALVELVEAGDQRPALIGNLVRERYPWAVQLGEAKATHQELEEAFRAHGPTGSTLRKAVAFYLAAARYGGVPLSPFFKETRPGGDGAIAVRRSTTRRKRKDGQGASDQPPPPKPPEDRPDETQTMRREYFDLLREKAASSDSIDTDLLDRIERLIGVMDAEKGVPKGEE